MDVTATAPATATQPPARPAAAASAPSAPARDESTFGKRVRGAVADVLRGVGSGWEAQGMGSSVVVDKAAIYPIESVYTATDLLKKATADVKYVNKATGILHTVGMFGGLIYATNTSGMLRAPGDTGNEMLHQVADLVDGQKTSQGWNSGIIIPPTGNGPFGDIVAQHGGDPTA